MDFELSGQPAPPPPIPTAEEWLDVHNKVTVFGSEELSELTGEWMDVMGAYISVSAGGLMSLVQAPADVRRNPASIMTRIRTQIRSELAGSSSGNVATS
jgi:hypothetical protein